ncbi:unnamed protein product [Ostreobium quekettii]|uniref:Protein kinase domain-containing protein n=1 Tax=Ostreobium quekettii TaxID=121088 RepID=A0A8S1IN00_9CHLO|nr:unnamed protein product [Ostreobium quekettii]|eukprot:evm.model.scf_680.1 EVM.evm.TU.scf_680.1   scf_680:4844-5624(-)
MSELNMKSGAWNGRFPMQQLKLDMSGDKAERNVCTKEEDMGWSKKHLLLLKCATALKHFHNRQIIHSDVKGNNFLVYGSHQEDCQVKLADFGLASDDTFTGRMTARWGGGTNVYIAPEVYLGDVPAVQLDIFALGIVIYEVVTGKQAYHVEGKQVNEHCLMEMKTLGRRGETGLKPAPWPQRTAPRTRTI